MSSQALTTSTLIDDATLLIVMVSVCLRGDREAASPT
jgi:hypothetical protein